MGGDEYLRLKTVEWGKKNKSSLKLKCGLNTEASEMEIS